MCDLLYDAFPNSSQIKLVGLERSEDLTIRDFALSHNFILVTHDSDFADIAALYGPPPKVIWLRCGNQPTSYIATLLRNHKGVIEEFASDGLTACLEIL